MTLLALRPIGALLGAFLTAGCAGGLIVQDPVPIPVEVAQVALPPAKSFGAPRPQPPMRSNVEIARDFLDLSFQLESGTTLDRFTRFEDPVTVSLSGTISPYASRELDKLIARLRREAGLDITRLPDGAPARIVVEGISRRNLERAVPEAACFVLPTRITWEEFRSNPRRRDLAWSLLETREAATVFIPADIAPQEIRDCLHEEIAQALGPLNDLYRLDDSIFNDDNMNSVLTGFDMLILQVTYDPRLRSGMSFTEIEAVLPTILAQKNPRGQSIATRPYQPSPKDWEDAIQRALGPGGSQGARRAAANRALAVAQEQNWQDTRMGLSLFTAGRLAAPRDGDLALEAFLGAEDVFRARRATEIHAAHVGMPISAFALASGEPDLAILIADRYIPVAQLYENAALLADFYFVKSAGLMEQGQKAASEAALREGFAWAQFGLRSEQEMRQRAAEIAALSPNATGEEAGI